MACPGTALAHEKWFYDAAPHRTHWEEAFRFPNVLGVSAAVALTVVAGLVWRALRRRDLIPGPEMLGATEGNRVRFYALVPLILGVHVGLPLFVLAVRGELFSPNNQLPGAWMYWLGVVEIGVGLSLIYGALARLAGAALARDTLGDRHRRVRPGGHAGDTSLPRLRRVLLPRRSRAIRDRPADSSLLEPPPHLAARAMLVLRVATGLGLAVVAFTGKLANPELAQAFLQRYPLNFTPWLGLPMPDQLFVLCAGSTELLIGLCLAFGFFPRAIIATAWLFINMTLTIFNWVELVGHLPLYGVMAVLLVWTPTDEDQRLWVRGVLGTTQHLGAPSGS